MLFLFLIITFLLVMFYHFIFCFFLTQRNLFCNADISKSTLVFIFVLSLGRAIPHLIFYPGYYSFLLAFFSVLFSFLLFTPFTKIFFLVCKICFLFSKRFVVSFCCVLSSSVGRIIGFLSQSRIILLIRYIQEVYTSCHFFFYVSSISCSPMCCLPSPTKTGCNMEWIRSYGVIVRGQGNHVSCCYGKSIVNAICESSQNNCITLDLMLEETASLILRGSDFFGCQGKMMTNIMASCLPSSDSHLTLKQWSFSQLFHCLSTYHHCI